MNWLKENWFKIGLLIIGFGFLVGAFYWYEVRPAQSYHYCNERAKESAREIESGEAAIKVYEVVYKACLREKGIYK